MGGARVGRASLSLLWDPQLRRDRERLSLAPAKGVRGWWLCFLIETVSQSRLHPPNTERSKTPRHTPPGQTQTD